MSATIRFNYFKDGGGELTSLLSDSNIPVQVRRSDPGVVIASASFLDVVTVLGGASLIPSIAAVLVQWLKNKASRKVIVQTKDREIVHIEGMSPSEVAKVLESAHSLTAIQAESDDPAP
tara:strand:- start:110 stop:466 length:357 start_codon:yes stop_codon:yes gene_type:complete